MPAPATTEMAYAVHTSTCTYLLDDDGTCRWIVSQLGVVPAHVLQCIGAQFVACLDVTVEGALLPDLRPGGRALFVRESNDRLVLLRTGPILHVDDRRPRDAGEIEVPAPAPVAATRAPVHRPISAREYGRPVYRAEPGNHAPIAASPSTQRIPPSFGVVEYHGEEQTITISRTSHRDLSDGVTRRDRR
jgi:hypothetical protein